MAAHADLVSVDYVNSGDGLLTRDTQSGLEWLDWPVTSGLTVAEGVSAHAGFRSATSAEFNALLIHAGLANTSAYGQSTTAAQGFVSLFNSSLGACPELSGGALFACGVYDYGDGTARLVNVGFTALDGGFAGDGFGPWPLTFANSFYGVLLVRESAATAIPEPATMALIGLATLGFAGLRRGGRLARRV
jgi:hypothetical protein